MEGAVRSPRSVLTKGIDVIQLLDYEVPLAKRLIRLHRTATEILDGDNVDALAEEYCDSRILTVLRNFLKGVEGDEDSPCTLLPFNLPEVAK